MGPWSLLKVNFIPMTLGAVFSFGLITCFIVAVLTGHCSPYMPFISETGGKYPEAGLFSIFLYLSATLGLSTMFVRYLIVDELNKGIDRSIDILNRATTVIGFIALMGMVVVAAYPMTTIGTAHGIGANVLFLGCVIYAILQTFLSYRMSPTHNGLTVCHIRLVISVLAAIALISKMTTIMTAHVIGADTLFFGADIYAVLQTWLSFKMSPYYNGLTICYIRLTLSVLSTIALLAMLIIGPKAFDAWGSGAHRHWTGSKLPLDKGFGLMVASSVSEWSMAILFLAYYFTFIREFGKVIMHLRIQLLVEHFDDDPQDINTSTANERTPIVM